MCENTCENMTCKVRIDLREVRIDLREVRVDLPNTCENLDLQNYDHST
jgi:dynactin complex subunit